MKKGTKHKVVQNQKVSQNMYRQEIIDYYKHPKNFGKLENPDVQSKKINFACGDVADLQLKLDKRGKISDAKFTGGGCAISIASASILTEMLKGKTLEQAKKIKSGELIKKLGIEISPVRMKCALLILDALRDCVIIERKGK